MLPDIDSVLSQTLESRFSFLDALPDALYQRVVTLRHGRLQQRVEGILQWRAALLLGELPDMDELCWPERTISEIILKRMDALELALHCRNEESLVDHVLKDICTAVESVEQWRQEGVEGLFDDVLPSQKPRHRENPSDLPAADNVSGDASNNTSNKASDDPQQNQRAEVDNALSQSNTQESGGSQTIEEQTIEEIDTDGQSHGNQPLVPDIATDLQQRWKTLLTHWEEADAVFRGMGTRLGRGWDLSTGVLVSEGWREFVAYRKFVKDHPYIKTLVDNLGRSTGKAVEEAGQQEITQSGIGEEQPHHVLPRMKKIRSEDPMSTHGVTYSDDIARMLPQEAAYLGHSQLHMLWHAKRAEQALLSYHVEGVLSQHHPEQAGSMENQSRKATAAVQTRGPFIVCTDTSASMHGEPERMAKALCLEVIRLANQQKRAVLLYAFSGPGQLLETSLEFSPRGLKSIIRFLQQSFHGGTDISEPIARAAARVKQSPWRQADMLLISDGRFPVPGSEVVESLRLQRQKSDLRIQGIIIGPWKTTSMDKICQTVYRIDGVKVRSRRLG